MATTPWRVPDPPDAPFSRDPATISKWIRSLNAWATAQFRRRTPDDSARAQLLLVSPNGSVYSVTVEDDGDLVTTVIISGT